MAGPNSMSPKVPRDKHHKERFWAAAILLALTLALLCLSGCGGGSPAPVTPVTTQAPTEAPTQPIETDGSVIPDFEAYAGTRLIFDYLELDTSGDHFTLADQAGDIPPGVADPIFFQGKRSDLDIVTNYVEFLCDELDFELINSGDQSGSIREYLLLSEHGQHAAESDFNGAKGDVKFRVVEDGGSIFGTLYWGEDLTYRDNGLRYTPGPNSGQSVTEADRPIRYLMADPPAEGAENRTVFGSDLLRQEIDSITFLFLAIPGDSIPIAWDVSRDQDGTVWAWTEQNGDQIDLFIGADGYIAAPEDCTGLFAYYNNAQQIVFDEVFTTDSVISMNSMFVDCTDLEQLDLSGFDTSNVTDMSRMFCYCANLHALDVSSFDTSQVTDMDGMFIVCRDLEQLNLSNFDTSQVTILREMFAECSALEQLDVSSFDTSRVTNMSAMFTGCESLQTLDVKHFDTSRVTDMFALFERCSSLQTLDLSGWDISQVNDMRYMFFDCSGLTRLIADDWDISHVENTDKLFDGCGVSCFTPGSSVTEPAIQPATQPATQPPADQAVQVTGSLDPSALSMNQGADLTDFRYYAQDKVEMGELKQSGSSFTMVYECKKDAKPVLEAYVKLLCDQYGFSYGDDPYYSSRKKATGSVVEQFDYLLIVDGGSRKQESLHGTAGDVYIYGTIERGRIEGGISWNSDLIHADEGYRYGQEGRSQPFAGQSLTAGLQRMPDGSFRTDDGRLTAKVGQAQVLSGSDKALYNARYVITTKDSRQWLLVEDATGTAVQRLYIPSSEKWTVGLMDTDPFIRADSYVVSEGGLFDRMPSYTWERMYALRHGSRYVVPSQNMGGEMNGLNLRVMYQDNSTLVLYAAASFDSAPKTLETLIAVSTDVKPQQSLTSGSSSSDSSSGSGTSVPGSGTGLQCSRCWGNKKISCDSCNGSGEKDCGYCNGAGGRNERKSGTGYDGSSGSYTVWVSCTRCGGSKKQDCSTCWGSGKVDCPACY